MDIEPQRAAVKPRVRLDDGGTVPLENEILPLLHGGASGIVALIGGAGSGRTTALRHLACLIAPDARIELWDSPQLLGALLRPGMTVYTAERAWDLRHVAIFHIAPWTSDDLIEYLLAKHKDQCASVMKRVNAADGAKLLGGNPELWSVVLDEFAVDESLTRFGDALLKYLRARLDETRMAQAQKGCLAKLLASEKTQRRRNSGSKHIPTGLENEDWGFLDQIAFGEEAWRLCRHEAVLMLLAREQALADLREDRPCHYLNFKLPRTFMRMLAAAAKDMPRILEQLRRLALDSNLQAMAGSILHAAWTGWKPDRKTGLNLFARKMDLCDGYFERAQWPGMDLKDLDCKAADFSNADLSGATLDRADLTGANFRRSKLRKASMKEMDALLANFSHADLSGAKISGGIFNYAIFNGANIENAELWNASFENADLRGAKLCRSYLALSKFAAANIEGADFRQADLIQANLIGLRLRDANFAGASFQTADLRRCDLEFMELPGADFRGANLSGAVLTGSFIPKGWFEGANLSNTGLADIEWERANLRNADLRGCTFHMGSSRAGRVESDIACEGSRTAFYTDEYYEQSYKAPEQIRKANLRGADLRGAKIEGVDFYLVDLREAHYDLQHEAHLRRCGAILETRV